MADGRENNGGKREGAGRKSKRDEDDLRKRLKKASRQDGQDLLDRVFVQLFKDAALSPSHKVRSEARKLLLAYWYGRPLQRVEATGEDGKDLFPSINVIIESPTPSQAGSGPSESGD
jgi:hypothetical protein